MSEAVLERPARPGLRTRRRSIGRPAWTTVILAGLTVLAAGLRFVAIGHQSFWYDESFTVVLVHRSPGQMLGQLPRTELTPPLYYCIAWVWARIFGYGEVGLRSLSAVAGVATVPAIYAAGAKLISRRVGLVAAALVCCNPLLIWYSQEARSYSLLVLLATLSLLAFAHARVPNPTSRSLALWALVASLTLTTHYYAVVAVVPQALWLLWVHRRDRRVLLAVGAAGAVGLALLPLATAQQPQASWIPRWPLDQRLSQIAPQFLLGTGAPARTALKLLGAASVVLAGILLWRRGTEVERRGGLLMAGLALSGFLLALGLVAAGADELITRNVILVLIPLIVLVAAGLGAHRAGALGLLGAGTLCVVGVVAAVAVAVDWQLQRPDWRAVARVIGPTPAAGASRAVLLEYTGKEYPLPLYMSGLHFMNRGERVHEVDLIGVVHGPNDGWFCWWGSTCNLKGAPLDEAIRLRGFHRYGPILRVGVFAILRLRANGAMRLTPSEVYHAFRKSSRIPWYTLLIQPASRVQSSLPGVKSSMTSWSHGV